MSNRETTRLSENLRSIYELELSLGNVVDYVAENAWTECPYAVSFKSPLHVDEIAAQLQLPPGVTYWESTDPHYAIEGGYRCAQTRHAIAGPLPGRR